MPGPWGDCVSPITLSPGCYQTLELSLHSMDVFTSHSQCAFNKTFSDLHTLPAKRLSQEETSQERNCGNISVLQRGGLCAAETDIRPQRKYR